MEFLKLEDITKEQYGKNIKVVLKEKEIEIKRLKAKIKIKELDKYDMLDCMTMASKASESNDVNEIIKSNANYVLKGTKDSLALNKIENQEKLGCTNGIAAVMTIFTELEIAEISMKVLELSKRDNTIGEIGGLES